MTTYNEKAFEDLLEIGFLNSDKRWAKGNPKDYNSAYGLYINDLIEFFKISQPNSFKKLQQKTGDKLEKIIVNEINTYIDAHGLLNILNGTMKDPVKIKGIPFHLIMKKPSSDKNPQLIHVYNSLIFKIYRQTVVKTTGNDNKPDIILAINGFPLVIMELKTIKSQTINHAIEQFKNDRKPTSSILYEYNYRSLLSLAVTEYEVQMTTKLNGKNTFFLPLNKIYQDQDQETEELPSSFLWKEFLTTDNFLDLVCNFMFKDKNDIIISPRYHQWDVVKKLQSCSKNTGTGKNYLIQHSAGSGKTKSISWLAHSLTSLYNQKQEHIYNSVIVLVDRTVLDAQIKQEISSMAKTKGVVAEIDSTKELITELNNETNIIISTIQKFAHIAGVLSNHKNELTINLDKHKFAIIIDEAHSSQGGTNTSSMNSILGNFNDTLNDFMENNNDTSSDYYGNEEYQHLNKDQRKKQRKLKEMELAKKSTQENLSIFAFTATPKYKTLIAFGEKPTGSEEYYKPFHLYSMEQAIKEGFILDVLVNYSTYESYFRINTKNNTYNTKEVDSKQAKRQIMKYLHLHPTNISQKIAIIVEHFKDHVVNKINNKAKAMIVTSSREEAYKYKIAFDNYLIENNIPNIKTLVAFSGKLHVDGETVTEVGINNISEKQLPKEFAGDEYQVLLVASKYQTGFDQPLLHTMYVLKPLSGVNAVQTLSRLNRTHKYKNSTSVLDFVNKHDEIQKAFEPFYKQSKTINKLEDLNLKEIRLSLDAFKIYSQDNIEKFINVYMFDKTSQKIVTIINKIIEKVKTLDEINLNSFKKQIETYIKVYSYLSSVIIIEDQDDSKFFIFSKYINKMLKSINLEADINDDVKSMVKLIKSETNFIDTMDITLGNENADVNSPDFMNGQKKEKSLMELLEQVIKDINDKYGLGMSEEECKYAEEIPKDLYDMAKKDKDFMTFIKNNNPQHNMTEWNNKIYTKKLIEIYKKIKTNNAFINTLMTNPKISEEFSKAIFKQILQEIQDA